MTVSITQRLKPRAQRERDLVEQMTLLRGQLRIAEGIKVIVSCSCGHAACGNPLPETLPEDAWVVQLGCKQQEPQQVTSEDIKEQIDASRPLTPQQRADNTALKALARSIPLPRASS